MNQRILAFPVYFADHFRPRQAAQTLRYSVVPLRSRFSAWQAQSVLRRLESIHFVDMDLVEVAPPYDVSDVTSFLAAHLLFDMLCLLADARAARSP